MRGTGGGRSRPNIHAAPWSRVVVAYEDESVIHAPLSIVWRLLDDHRDDRKLPVIHPLVQSQTTVSRTDHESVVDRVIDVRRKFLKSRWKMTYHPPESARWDVLEGEGPWAPGSFIEAHYEEIPGGTRVRARGELTILKLPFFLSQSRWVARVLNDIDIEDWAYIQRYRF